MNKSIKKMSVRNQSEEIILQKCLYELNCNRLVTIKGLSTGALGLMLSQLFEILNGIVITPSEEKAEELESNINFFSQRRISQILSPDPYGLLERELSAMGALYRFFSGDIRTIVTTPQGLLLKVPSEDKLRSSTFSISVGREENRQRIIERLIELGYERVPMVEIPGEFSLRGAILDIYPPGSDNPLRIEFHDEYVESIRLFDVRTQRSIRFLEKADIGAARLEGEKTLLSSLYGVVVMVDPEEVLEEIRNLEEAEGRQILRVLEELPRILINPMIAKGAELHVETHKVTGLREKVLAKGLSALASFLSDYLAEGYEIHLVSSTPYQTERLKELLKDYGFTFDGYKEYISFETGELTEGFVWPSLRLLYITELEIFGKRVTSKSKRPQEKRSALSSISIEDLTPGDYVVHVDYGIGIFRGLKRLDVNGLKDFLMIEYEGGDKLYVPVERLNLIHKWIGPSDHPPKLSRLGGTSWQRLKIQTKKAVAEVARELLELYVQRKTSVGFAFSPPDPLFREFEATFPYEETPDQLEAIEAVLRDMTSPYPMDRLICGDVGFGKTEVAIRAAFKAVMDNKQVAVLVPTTVLAEQHLRTFRERFERYPIVVESLSRFKTPREQKEILKRLKAGKIDVIIGTHRLLQKDVEFKDLGLLIVDEEQRFGVKHKERLKELKRNVDCLTLTATPIPRTLQMALIGIKEISLITTPPPERQPIKTRIIPFDKKLIRKAILFEIERGGQVFFIHNRVADIFNLKRQLEEIVPEAQIGVAHGQMSSKDLEKVMYKFVTGQINVLLCTSIVELGLDIPNANTIIVNEAHTFGLADLYQLRGRVGRSWKKAFAYFIVPSTDLLTKDARRRLKALEEFTELGSGFKLAMKDLEIRGTGTLFGHRQSGHVFDVGFELYQKLLEETLRELKGEKPRPLTPEINIPIEAYIPADYIESDAERLLVYRRLSMVEDSQELEEIKEELKDRYGPIPAPLKGLLEVISLKLKLQKLGIRRLDFTGEGLRLKFLPDSPFRELVLSKAIKESNTKVVSSDELIVKLKGDWKKFLLRVESWVENPMAIGGER